MIEVERTFSFEAAHHLPLLPEGHKCRRPHGHSYEVTITVFGDLDANGMVIDYEMLGEAWENVGERLDHRDLNELRWPSDLERPLFQPQPTTEVIARWIAGQIRKELVWRVHCFQGGVVAVSEGTGKDRGIARVRINE